MGFLTSMFGGAEDNIWTPIMALVIVLVLIVLGLWLLKLVSRASGSIARGRQRRLAVVDTIALDAKRSLILIRRDDVEHLIITNGSNDVVVETGIAVPAPAEPKPAKSAPAQATPSGKRDAAAQRLGLSRILRASKSANSRREPKLPPREGPISRLRKLDQGQSGQEPGSASLRHTGLLRPVSEMETVFPLEGADNIAPPNGDSATSDIQEVDAQAMVSVEEGANPANVEAQQDPPKQVEPPKSVEPPEAGKDEAGAPGAADPKADPKGA